jgi:DNA-binding CsgD family transcriptional regulator
MIQPTTWFGGIPVVHYGASHQEGRRGIIAHRPNDELPAHRKRARDFRIHGSQAPCQHSQKAGPADDGSIDGACDCHPAQHLRFVILVCGFSRSAAGLRPRETEIVQLVCSGLTSKEIARRLRLSPLTVRKHRENAMRRLDVHSMAELMDVAQALGIASTPSEPYRAN